MQQLTTAAAAATFLSGRQQFLLLLFSVGGCNSKNKPSFNKTKLEWLLSGNGDGPEEELFHRPSIAVVFHYYYM